MERLRALARLVHKRTAVMVAACVMIAGGAAGGTVAWLIGQSPTITNTFTPSQMAVTVAETTGANYLMVPGGSITKDPTVTLAQGSEDAWLFVKLEESDNFGDYLTYSVVLKTDSSEGWTALAGEKGVYYRETIKSDQAQNFQVLADNKVTVLSTVTLPMLNEIAENREPAPTLSVTAYAVQKQGVDSASDAWKLIEDDQSATP